MQHLIFGYRHHKTDREHEAHLIIHKRWYQTWSKRLALEIENINLDRDLKAPIIITFVTKL